MDDWKEELHGLLHREQQQRGDLAARAREDNVAREIHRKKAVAFVEGTLGPAFSELEKGLREQNLRVYHRIEESGTTISIGVQRQGQGRMPGKEFLYAIDVTCSAAGITPQVRGTGFRAHEILRAGQILKPDQITTDDVIRDFMQAYKSTFNE